MKRKKGKSYQQSHTEFFLQLKEASGKTKHSGLFLNVVHTKKRVLWTLTQPHVCESPAGKTLSQAGFHGAVFK